MKVHFDNCAHGVMLEHGCRQCEQETPVGCGRMIDLEHAGIRSMDADSGVRIEGKVHRVTLSDGVSTKDGVG